MLCPFHPDDEGLVTEDVGRKCAVRHSKLDQVRGCFTSVGSVVYVPHSSLSHITLSEAVKYGHGWGNYSVLKHYVQVFILYELYTNCILSATVIATQTDPTSYKYSTVVVYEQSQDRSKYESELPGGGPYKVSLIHLRPAIVIEAIRCRRKGDDQSQLP